MSISGSLEDVAVADVLQFIHLGKRTGTLVLEREGERARFGFHEGTLVRAHAPGAPRLGELLLASGRVDTATLHDAMAAQAATGGRRSLGSLLLESGRLERAALQQAVRQQLERAVERVMTWERGSFEFALDEIRPFDDIGMDAVELSPDEAVPANVVLLEAARIFDERDRRRSPESLDQATEQAIDDLLEDTSAPAEQGPELRALTPDRDFARRLRTALAGVARVRRVALGRATEPPQEGVSELVLVDARPGAFDPEALELLHATRPDCRLIVLVDSREALQLAYRHGAAAALPAEVETVRACVLNLIGGPLAEPAPALGDSGVRRLQRVFGELRPGTASATVALSLMQLVSESYERAVLLLVKKERLSALGAFGAAADGQPLAVKVRRLEVVPSGMLRAALVTSQVQNGAFAAADLPGALAAALATPRNEQVVVLPVAGTERVIAIVYADNGDSPQPPRDVELLELAAAQVGIAFENELLRRQLGKG